MRPDFWIQKWESHEIGFHQENIHPLLQKYWPSFGLTQGSRVFVPLCGKSKDMVWLAEKGHEIMGVELSEVAIESFFLENNLKINNKAGNVFQSGRLELIKGDFFDVTHAQMRKVEAVYERASLIALPVDMRIDYVKHMNELLDPGTLILLITLEYTEGLINPPPFPVSRYQVEELYRSWCEIEHLETIAADVKGKYATESAYRLQVR